MDRSKSSRPAGDRLRTGQPKASRNNGALPPSKRPGAYAVSNKVHIDPINPIPIEVGGRQFSSLGGTMYIPFLPPKNDFAQTLLEASMLSVTQRACISTKTNYTVGGGFFAKHLDNLDQDKQFKNFLNSCNGRNQSLATVGRRLIGSDYTFGNTPVEIVIGEEDGEKFVYVYSKNFLDCRLSKPDINTGYSDTVIISRLFRRQMNMTKTDMAEIKLYKMGEFDNDDYWTEDEGSSTRRTALWIKNEMDGYDDYGMPSSVASLIFQMLEYNGGRYNLDLIDNQMVIGGLLVLAGNLDDAECTKIARKIKDQHTGPGKRGRVSVISSQQGITDSKYAEFNTKKEGSYKDMDEMCEKKIILANEWDAVLAGLQTGSSLGKGSGYLEEIYYQKLQTVIRPQQNKILEQFIKPLMEICDQHLGTNWTDYEVDFQPAQITNKSSALITSPEGVAAFLDIVKAVQEGYPLKAAIKLVSSRFGLTEKDASEQLGDIQPKTSTNVPGNNEPGANPDNPGGGNP